MRFPILILAALRFSSHATGWTSGGHVIRVALRMQDKTAQDTQERKMSGKCRRRAQREKNEWKSVGKASFGRSFVRSFVSTPSWARQAFINKGPKKRSTNWRMQRSTHIAKETTVKCNFFRGQNEIAYLRAKRENSGTRWRKKRQGKDT